MLPRDCRTTRQMKQHWVHKPCKEHGAASPVSYVRWELELSSIAIFSARCPPRLLFVKSQRQRTRDSRFDIAPWEKVAQGQAQRDSPLGLQAAPDMRAMTADGELGGAGRLTVRDSLLSRESLLRSTGVGALPAGSQSLRPASVGFSIDEREGRADFLHHDRSSSHMAQLQGRKSSLLHGGGAHAQTSALSRIAGFATAGRASLDANTIATLAASTAARRQHPQKRSSVASLRRVPRPKSSMFADENEAIDRSLNLPPRAKSALSNLQPGKGAGLKSPVQIEGRHTPLPGQAGVAWDEASSSRTLSRGATPARSVGTGVEVMRSTPADVAEENRRKEAAVQALERRAAYIEHCTERLEERLHARIPADVQAALDHHRTATKQAARVTGSVQDFGGVLDFAATTDRAAFDADFDAKLELYLAQHRTLHKMPGAAVAIQSWWRMLCSRKRLRAFLAASRIFRKRSVAACVRAWRVTVEVERGVVEATRAKFLAAWKALARNVAIWEEEAALIFLECARKGGLPQRALFLECNDRRVYGKCGLEYNWGRGWKHGRPVPPRTHAMIVQVLRRKMIWSCRQRLRRWRRAVSSQTQRSRQAVQALATLEASLLRARAWLALVMWHRWAATRAHRRAGGMQPPGFEPALREWDEWVAAHDARQRGKLQDSLAILRPMMMRRAWRGWLGYAEERAQKKHLVALASKMAARSLRKKAVAEWRALWHDKKAEVFHMRVVFSSYRNFSRRKARERAIEQRIRQDWQHRIMRVALAKVRKVTATLMVLHAAGVKAFLEQPTRGLWALTSWLTYPRRDSARGGGGAGARRKPGGLCSHGVCDGHPPFVRALLSWKEFAARRRRMRALLLAAHFEARVSGAAEALAAWRRRVEKRTKRLRTDVPADADEVAFRGWLGGQHRRMAGEMERLRAAWAPREDGEAELLLLDAPTSACLLHRLADLARARAAQQQQRALRLAELDRLDTRARVDACRPALDARLGISAKNAGQVNKALRWLRDLVARHRAQQSELAADRVLLLARDYKLLLAGELRDSFRAYGEVYAKHYPPRKGAKPIPFSAEGSNYSPGGDAGGLLPRWPRSRSPSRASPSAGQGRSRALHGHQPWLYPLDESPDRHTAPPIAAPLSPAPAASQAPRAAGTAAAGGAAGEQSAGHTEEAKSHPTRAFAADAASPLDAGVSPGSKVERRARKLHAHEERRVEGRVQHYADLHLPRSLLAPPLPTEAAESAGKDGAGEGARRLPSDGSEESESTGAQDGAWAAGLRREDSGMSVSPLGRRDNSGLSVEGLSASPLPSARSETGSGCVEREGNAEAGYEPSSHLAPGATVEDREGAGAGERSGGETWSSESELSSSEAEEVRPEVAELSIQQRLELSLQEQLSALYQKMKTKLKPPEERRPLEPFESDPLMALPPEERARRLEESYAAAEKAALGEGSLRGVLATGSDSSEEEAKEGGAGGAARRGGMDGGESPRATTRRMRRSSAATLEDAIIEASFSGIALDLSRPSAEALRRKRAAAQAGQARAPRMRRGSYDGPLYSQVVAHAQAARKARQEAAAAAARAEPPEGGESPGPGGPPSPLLDGSPSASERAKEEAAPPAAAEAEAGAEAEVDALRRKPVGCAAGRAASGAGAEAEAEARSPPSPVVDTQTGLLLETPEELAAAAARRSAEEEARARAAAQQAVWDGLVGENEWVGQEAAAIREALRGGLDSLYWRSQVVANRTKRQLAVQRAIDADFALAGEAQRQRTGKAHAARLLDELNVLTQQPYVPPAPAPRLPRKKKVRPKTAASETALSPGAGGAGGGGSGAGGELAGRAREQRQRERPASAAEEVDLEALGDAKKRARLRRLSAGPAAVRLARDPGARAHKAVAADMAQRSTAARARRARPEGARGARGAQAPGNRAARSTSAERVLAVPQLQVAPGGAGGGVAAASRATASPQALAFPGKGGDFASGVPPANGLRGDGQRPLSCEGQPPRPVSARRADALSPLGGRLGGDSRPETDRGSRQPGGSSRARAVFGAAPPEWVLDQLFIGSESRVRAAQQRRAAHNAGELPGRWPSPPPDSSSMAERLSLEHEALELYSLSSVTRSSQRTQTIGALELMVRDEEPPGLADLRQLGEMGGWAAPALPAARAVPALLLDSRRPSTASEGAAAREGAGSGARPAVGAWRPSSRAGASARDVRGGALNSAVVEGKGVAVGAGPRQGACREEEEGLVVPVRMERATDVTRGHGATTEVAPVGIARWHATESEGRAEEGDQREAEERLLGEGAGGAELLDGGTKETAEAEAEAEAVPLVRGRVAIDTAWQPWAGKSAAEILEEVGGEPLPRRTLPRGLDGSKDAGDTPRSHDEGVALTASVAAVLGEAAGCWAPPAQDDDPTLRSSSPMEGARPLSRGPRAQPHGTLPRGMQIHKAEPKVETSGLAVLGSGPPQVQTEAGWSASRAARRGVGGALPIYQAMAVGGSRPASSAAVSRGRTPGGEALAAAAPASPAPLAPRSGVRRSRSGLLSGLASRSPVRQRRGSARAPALVAGAAADARPLRGEATQGPNLRATKVKAEVALAREGVRQGRLHEARVPLGRTEANAKVAGLQLQGEPLVGRSPPRAPRSARDSPAADALVKPRSDGLGESDAMTSGTKPLAGSPAEDSFGHLAPGETSSACQGPGATAPARQLSSLHEAYVAVPTAATPTAHGNSATAGVGCDAGSEGPRPSSLAAQSGTSRSSLHGASRSVAEAGSAAVAGERAVLYDPPVSCTSSFTGSPRSAGRDSSPDGLSRSTGYSAPGEAAGGMPMERVGAAQEELTPERVGAAQEELTPIVLGARFGGGWGGWDEGGAMLSETSESSPPVRVTPGGSGALSSSSQCAGSRAVPLGDSDAAVAEEAALQPLALLLEAPRKVTAGDQHALGQAMQEQPPEAVGVTSDDASERQELLESGSSPNGAHVPQRLNGEVVAGDSPGVECSGGERERDGHCECEGESGEDSGQWSASPPRVVIEGQGGEGERVKTKAERRQEAQQAEALGALDLFSSLRERRGVVQRHNSVLALARGMQKPWKLYGAKSRVTQRGLGAVPLRDSDGSGDEALGGDEEHWQNVEEESIEAGAAEEQAVETDACAEAEAGAEAEAESQEDADAERRARQEIIRTQQRRALDEESRRYARAQLYTRFFEELSPRARRARRAQGVDGALSPGPRSPPGQGQERFLTTWDGASEGSGDSPSRGSSAGSDAESVWGNDSECVSQQGGAGQGEGAGTSAARIAPRLNFTSWKKSRALRDAHAADREYEALRLRHLAKGSGPAGSAATRGKRGEVRAGAQGEPDGSAAVAAASASQQRLKTEGMGLLFGNSVVTPTSFYDHAIARLRGRAHARARERARVRRGPDADGDASTSDDDGEERLPLALPPAQVLGPRPGQILPGGNSSSREPVDPAA